MNGRIILRALGKTIMREGGKAARILGEKAASATSEFAVKKGLLEKKLTWDEVLAELKEAHRSGRINSAELNRIKNEMMERYKKRKESSKGS